MCQRFFLLLVILILSVGTSHAADLEPGIQSGDSFDIWSISKDKPLSARASLFAPVERWAAGQGGDFFERQFRIKWHGEYAQLEDAIYHPSNNSKECLSVAGRNKQGNRIVTKKCKNEDRQKWKIIGSDYFPGTKWQETKYQIKNKDSGLCLDIASNSDAQIYSCNDGNAQKFSFTYKNDDFISSSEKVDIFSTYDANSENLRVYWELFPDADYYVLSTSEDKCYRVLRRDATSYSRELKESDLSWKFRVLAMKGNVDDACKGRIAARSDVISYKSGEEYVGIPNLVRATPELQGESSNVIASGIYANGYEAWKAFDNNPATRWISKVWEDPAIVGFNFDKKIKVREYRIKSSTYGGGSRAPRWFFLQGSNDGGSWVDLDSRTNETLWGNDPYRSFRIDNPKLFSKYRLLVKHDNDDRANVVVVSIGELELFHYENVVRLMHVESKNCLFSGNDTSHWGCWDDPNMEYVMVADGLHYRFKHKMSGKCLSASTSEGASIPSRKCDRNDDRQLFDILDIGNDEVRLKNISTNRCLYTTGGNGGDVNSWGCWNDSNMKFMLLK